MKSRTSISIDNAAGRFASCRSYYFQMAVFNYRTRYHHLHDPNWSEMRAMFASAHKLAEHYMAHGVLA